jgi:arylsulfatase A-like enzyme
MASGNQLKSSLRRQLWWLREAKPELERWKFLSQKRKNGWRPPSGDRPNIVLLSIDSMAARHLGCYGYRRKTSPTMDRLAASGILFENVIAQTNWTKPSLASLHTSLYPSVHKTDSRGETGDRTDEQARNRANILDVRFRTMAQEFKEGGYLTAGVSNGGYAHSFFGFGRGFDYYENQGGGLKSCGYRMLQWVLKDSNAPFFAWIHAWDIHFPYMDRPPYNRLFTSQRAEIVLDAATRYRVNQGDRNLTAGELEFLEGMYDGAIKYVDDLIATFVHELEHLGLSQNTILVITADHGEAFMEHGFVEHTECLYGEVLQVPLILVGPGLGGGRRIKSQARLIDIMPTLLELGGLSPQADIQGASLLPWIAGNVSNNLIAASETERGGGQVAISDGLHKLIKRKSDGRMEVYDLAADPKEKSNIAVTEPGALAKMENLLASWLRETKFRADRYWSDDAGAENTEMSAEVVGRLQDLGYLE